MDGFQTQEKRGTAITHRVKECISDGFPNKSNQILPRKLNGTLLPDQSKLSRSQQSEVTASHVSKGGSSQTPPWGV